ncbi:MAG: molybdopterin converting factor subunit 2 protein [Robiginitomaculum sp.]|nr:MAG: molybdopterin converting factor subunit 2 protein [Robiginitomaculum sp.]
MSIHVEVRDTEKQVLDPSEALAFVDAPGNGAGALFVGAVRDFNQGRSVKGVSYDVFAPLAEQSFAEICAEAQTKWGENLRLFVVHGKGRLGIGGLSIVIAAGSPHRGEAFSACRYVIEEIKSRSPVWKQEHYVDGDSEWVKGHALCGHD